MAPNLQAVGRGAAAPVGGFPPPFPGEGANGLWQRCATAHHPHHSLGIAFSPSSAYDGFSVPIVSHPMYLAIRCKFDRTEEALADLSDRVGGPEDEFHVSSPSYLSPRFDVRDEDGTPQLSRRFMFPGLVFVQEWARPMVREFMQDHPSQSSRWLFDPRERSPLRVLPSEILQAEVNAAQLDSRMVVDEMEWASRQVNGVRVIDGPFGGLTGEVVSRHHNGFFYPHFMVQLPVLRATIKVDSCILRTT